MKKLLLMVFCVIALVVDAMACAAITKKGTQCKRAPSPGSQYCWQHGGTTKSQRAAGMTDADVAKNRCKATTKAGAQCKRQAKPGEKFCWQHASKSDEKSSAGETQGAASMKAPAKVPLAEAKSIPARDGQCTALTKKGTRCTRKAQPDSDKCWQHQ